MPGAQLEVLTALDKAKTQWYHMTAIVIAGMGFFTDAYDLFCITTVSKLLGRIYYADYTQPKPNNLPPPVNAAVNGVALCGTVIGQIFFGWMGDKLGRKKVYGVTLVIMILSSLGSGFSFGSRPKAVMTSLCFFRFWLGFGIGGDYPLSATIMSEYANKRTRGAFIAAVFAMQGMGLLTAAVVAITVSQIFIDITGMQHDYTDGSVSLPWEADYVWRLVFMFGAIPAAMTFYWRMKMPETARYTALVAGNAKQAAEDMTKVLEMKIAAEQEVVDKIVQAEAYTLWSMEFLKRHGLHLLGTTSTWLLLDIAFYSQNLFQKDLFTDVGWLKQPQHMSALVEVLSIAKAQALLALCSTVPGYWVTVLLIDKLGRFVIQLQGFFFMSLFLLIIGKEFYTFRGFKCSTNTKGYCGGNPHAFVVFYALIFFFSNFGPNSTTFIVPAELFPARFRATCHGISAAAGKLGAIIGAFGFLYIAQGTAADPKDIDKGYNPGVGPGTALIILACTNALGFLFTFLVPETMGRSLEDISGENEDIADHSTLSRTRQVRSGTDQSTDEAP